MAKKGVVKGRGKDHGCKEVREGKGVDGDEVADEDDRIRR